MPNRAAQLDLRAPSIALHAPVGRELALNIPVTGGTLTSPVLAMKTRAGAAFTTDPGVGVASMADSDSLRLVWSAADMAALEAGARPVEYRIEVTGVVDAGVPTQVLAGTLTAYPTTWGRPIPAHELGTLVLNGGSAITLAVTVPTPDGPIDGGRSNEVYGGGLPGLDGGTAASTFTETLYDGGRA